MQFKQRNIFLSEHSDNWQMQVKLKLQLESKWEKAHCACILGCFWMGSMQRSHTERERNCTQVITKMIKGKKKKRKKVKMKTASWWAFDLFWLKVIFICWLVVEVQGWICEIKHTLMLDLTNTCSSYPKSQHTGICRPRAISVGMLWAEH